MIDELRKLRELTETLTGNGYLRDQADEWAYALDAIPDYIFIINNAFKIKFVNRALSDKLGKSKEELYNKLCFQEIREYPSGLPSSNWQGRESVTLYPNLQEVYVENLDGWFDITRSPIYTNSGDNLGFICVYQDVSDKRNALDDLIDREAMLETIFNTVPIGMGTIEAKSRIIFSVNKYLLDILGYTEKELVGNSVRVLYSSDDEFFKAGKTKYREIFDKGIGSVETLFKTKQGKILDVFLKTAVIGGDNLLVFTVLDITNRKNRERQLKLNEDRLESALSLSSMEQKTEEEVISYALEEAVRLTDSEVGYIHFVNEEAPDCVNLKLLKWSKNTEKNCSAERTDHYPLEKAGSWADCIRIGKPTICNSYSDLTEEQGKKGLPEGHINIERYMSVPIMDGAETVAIAGVGNKKTKYDKSDLRQLNLFMNSMWDIVKRKRSEDIAFKNEEKFKAVFMKSKDIISIIRIDNEKIVDVNPVFEKYSGWPKAYLIGKTTTELGLWQNKSEKDEFYNVVLKDGQVDDFISNFKLRDGTVKVGSISAVLVILNDVPHIISTIIDIT